MRTMKTNLRGLFQKTVWSHYNTAQIPARYHLLYTVILPLKYLLIGAYGLFSINVTISSIDRVFGPIYGDMWSVTLMVSGWTAMVGIMFYKRLIWLEVLSVVLLVTLMTLYTGCIFFAAILHVETFRYLSLLLVLVFLPMPCWRVLDMIRELRPVRNVS